jgi:prepilin-type N-terminal cleavage/methylation domain-containing protein
MFLTSSRVRAAGRIQQLRRGFTLAEVLVSIVILTVLAAVTIPTVQSRMTTARGNALARELLSLSSALNAFRTNVGNFPKNLDYLTTMGTEKYCSGLPVNNFSLGSQALWQGPYISRVITGSYSPDGYSTINDRLAYAAGPPALADITISNVDAQVATIVEDIIDGPGLNFTSGAFKWDQSTLQADYLIPGPTCP